MASTAAIHAISNDDIYFASLPVFFVHVPGETTAFVADEWREDPSSLPLALERFGLLAATDAGLPLCQPAIPALDLVRVPTPASTAAFEALPVELRRPLLKVREAEAGEGAIRGVASGTRSALIKLGSTWYRLKGCGNNDEGFTVKTERQAQGKPDDAPDDYKPAFTEFRQVRGSAFPHTAARELVVAGRVATALAARNAAGANEPIALMLYSDAAQQPLGPAIPTACIVERTIGDRRLGTHVLSGLELLLPLLVDEAAIDVAALREAFPPNRPRENGEIVDTTELIADHVLGATYAWKKLDLDAFGLAPFYDGRAGLLYPIPRDRSTMAHLSWNASASAAIAAAEHAPDVLTDPPLQFTREGSRLMPAEWRKVWRRCCEELKTAMAALPPGRSLLAYVFARLGDDAGACIRGMHDAGINWGTYQDAFCNYRAGAYHCNAHSNNLVLVAPDALPAGAPGAERLVSALDLDMAFDAQGFVHGFPASTASKTVGMPQAEFDELQQWEFLNLLEVMAGGDASNGVPMVAKATVERMTTPNVLLVKQALRDTMVLAFRSAYEGKPGHSVGRDASDLGPFPPAEPFDPTMHAATHALLRLAVIIMADFAA